MEKEMQWEMLNKKNRTTENILTVAHDEDGRDNGETNRIFACQAIGFMLNVFSTLDVFFFFVNIWNTFLTCFDVLRRKSTLQTRQSTQKMKQILPVECFFSRYNVYHVIRVKWSFDKGNKPQVSTLYADLENVLLAQTTGNNAAHRLPKNHKR